MSWEVRRSRRWFWHRVNSGGEARPERRLCSIRLPARTSPASARSRVAVSMGSVPVMAQKLSGPRVSDFSCVLGTLTDSLLQSLCYPIFQVAWSEEQGNGIVPLRGMDCY